MLLSSAAPVCVQRNSAMLFSTLLFTLIFSTPISAASIDSKDYEAGAVIIKTVPIKPAKSADKKQSSTKAGKGSQQ